MTAGARDLFAWVLKWWNAIVVPPTVVAKRFTLVGADNTKFGLAGSDNRNLTLRGTDNTNLELVGDP
jgi:hypothetical protein